MPEGAVYHARDGGLTLEARREGDSFRISAHSDSLSRRVEYYEMFASKRSQYADLLKDSLFQIREAYERLLATARIHQSQIEVERTRSPAHRGWWMLLGVIAGGVAGWWAHKTNLIQKLIKTF